MNLFVRQGKNNFHIHTIDPSKQFSITAFSKRTQENYRRFRSNLRFEAIKSSEINLTRRYDLAIIDGNHWPKTVRKDYQRVRKSAGWVLFDDLHIDTTYETAFAGIPEDEAEKVFCVYTRDDRNRDPHCIGLLKIK